LKFTFSSIDFIGVEDRGERTPREPALFRRMWLVILSDFVLAFASVRIDWWRGMGGRGRGGGVRI
jgi:hypothetical protein